MKKPFVPVKDDRPEAPLWLTALMFVIITAVGVVGGSLAAVLIPYFMFADADGDVSRREYERVHRVVEKDTGGAVRVRGIVGGVIGGVVAGAAGVYVLSMKQGSGK